MRCEFIAVWPETHREIWENLASLESAPNDLYCELYRALASALKSKPTVEELANVIDDAIQAKDAFKSTTVEQIAGERALVEFFEKAHEALDELGADALADRYFDLLKNFVEKFSLRYELCRPCMLRPTIPGIFASLVRDLKAVTSQDPHLDTLMKDYEDAVRDLRADRSDGRIRTCMVKQVNLLEAIGSQFPGVSANTFGQICDQVGTWPHSSVRDALKDLYKFTCNYPGIRHAGTPANAIRAIEMRDMIAMSILLAGFMPYLTDGFDADSIYRRS